MRKKNSQIVGDRLKPALSAASLAFVTHGRLSAGSTVAQKTAAGPFGVTPVTGPALNAGPDPPGPLPTVPRREFNVTSPAPRGSAALRDRNREVVGHQQKSAPSIADETLLTEQQLAARWSIAPKTLRNARVEGRLLGFVKIGRSVRYRLSEVIAFEEQNSVRSTSGGEQ
jgi:hypothetical protein